MRELGAVINYNMMIAIAKGIVTAIDRTLLKENGGAIELGSKWCESIAKQIGFVKHKATTAKSIIAPGLISEIGHIFYGSINEIVKAHEIPPEMIINKDQKSLAFILINKYSLEEKRCVKSISSGYSTLSSDYRHLRHNNGWNFPPNLIKL